MNLSLKLVAISLVLFNLQFINCDWPNFQLYTRSNSQNFLLANPTGGISNTPFNIGKKIYLVVHGWNGAGSNDWVLAMKDSLLTREDSNVIVVDWSEGASGLDYSVSANNVRISGARIGEFIRNIGARSSNIHCIGHSLGAHVCGFAGKAFKLGRITGLDPAGPLFKDAAPSDRLNKADADFVDVIHVDGLLGIQIPIGHKDFYPNGGFSQPGCFIIGKRDLDYYYNYPENRELVDLVACSHMKVNQFFIESITSSCSFSAVPCDNYDDFKKGKCTCSSAYGCSSMGFKSAINKEEGKFYLTTNSKTPFCKN